MWSDLYNINFDNELAKIYSTLLQEKVIEIPTIQV